jgi:hypothetical protein
MAHNTKVIEEYQCPGCVSGSDTGCGAFKPAEEGVGCGGHVAGTRGIGIGLVLLGMPKGFMRCGFEEHNCKPRIFEKITDQFDLFNVPVWKWKNEQGHVFVRGLQPRKNMTFLLVFLSPEGYDDIKCHELTAEELEKMDG